MTSYHVKIKNTGKAARVVHDGARPVRIGANETVDDILDEETIRQIQTERHDRDPSEEPTLLVEQGAKVEDKDVPTQPTLHQQQASTLGGEEAPAPQAHKRGPPHK
jgi:hypothetical protein